MAKRSSRIFIGNRVYTPEVTPPPAVGDQSIGFTRSTETDIAQTFSLTQAVTKAFTQALDTSSASAFAVAAALTLGFAQAVATDTAQPFGSSSTVSVGFSQT